LETVEAMGLSPAEVRERVLDRAAQVQEGDVARLFIDGVEASAYRLLDLNEVRAVAGAALHLKLEPSFAESTTPVELPDMDSMGARWDRYLEGQDMIGYDRPKIAALGHQYLSQAVEESAG
jgi:hypothetical protein